MGSTKSSLSNRLWKNSKVKFYVLGQGLLWCTTICLWCIFNEEFWAENPSLLAPDVSSKCTIWNKNEFLRVCAVSEKFGDISNPSTLVEMDSYLLDKSYLSDNIPSQLDVSAFQLLQKNSATKQLISQYFNLSRWFNHIQTFVNEFEFLPEACF